MNDDDYDTQSSILKLHVHFYICCYRFVPSVSSNEDQPRSSWINFVCIVVAPPPPLTGHANAVNQSTHAIAFLITNVIRFTELPSLIFKLSTDSYYIFWCMVSNVLVTWLAWLIYIYIYGRICDDEFFALDKISFNDKIYLPTGIELSIQECSGIDSEQISSPELNFQPRTCQQRKARTF